MDPTSRSATIEIFTKKQIIDKFLGRTKRMIPKD